MKATTQTAWCSGGGRTATSERACPVCGFKGIPTKYGMVRDHKERAA